MLLLKFNNVFIIWIIIIMKIEMIMFDESLYINNHFIFFSYYYYYYYFCYLFMIIHYLLNNNNIILYINLFNRFILNKDYFN